jgi:phage terminase large subunit-like protein
LSTASEGRDGYAYVLADVSGVTAPHKWAKTAIRLLRDRLADRIIAETNDGGETVENTLE